MTGTTIIMTIITAKATIITIETKMNGTFFGVGLGPGDPELITQKAVRVLREVDCIFLPASKSSEAGVARRIIATLGLPEDKLRPVALCMSGDRGQARTAYRDVADAIAEATRAGKSVAWIAVGDPLLYSTFIHVLVEVRERHPDVKIEVVPGISSASAAAARLRLPMASLDETVAIVPAAYAIERLPALMQTFATVFLFKVNAVFDRILDVLAAFGDEVEAHYLEHIGTRDETRVSHLQELRGMALPYFSLVVLRKRSPNE